MHAPAGRRPSGQNRGRAGDGPRRQSAAHSPATSPPPHPLHHGGGVPYRPRRPPRGGGHHRRRPLASARRSCHRFVDRLHRTRRRQRGGDGGAGGWRHRPSPAGRRRARASTRGCRGRPTGPPAYGGRRNTLVGSSTAVRSGGGAHMAATSRAPLRRERGERGDSDHPEWVGPHVTHGGARDGVMLRHHLQCPWRQACPYHYRPRTPGSGRMGWPWSATVADARRSDARRRRANRRRPVRVGLVR